MREGEIVTVTGVEWQVEEIAPDGITCSREVPYPTGGGTRVEWALFQPKDLARRCTCPTLDLSRRGCRCGALARRRP